MSDPLTTEQKIEKLEARVVNWMQSYRLFVKNERQGQAAKDEAGAIMRDFYELRVATSAETTPAPSVDVEALRSLPRHYLTANIYGGVEGEPDPAGAWVKWSDLAALLPPQTGEQP